MGKCKLSRSTWKELRADFKIGMFALFNCLDILVSSTGHGQDERTAEHIMNAAQVQKKLYLTKHTLQKGTPGFKSSKNGTLHMRARQGFKQCHSSFGTNNPNMSINGRSLHQLRGVRQHVLREEIESNGASTCLGSPLWGGLKETPKETTCFGRRGLYFKTH